MTDGITFLLDDDEREQIDIILEGGDHTPGDWERQFLGDMLTKEYLTIKQREKLDQLLKKFNVG